MVFGESRHDREALAVFVREIRSDAQPKAMATPVTLQRGTEVAKLRSWADSLAGTVRAQMAISNVVGVLVHRDADGPDPGGCLVEELDSQLVGIPVDARGIVPVQEIEAWWMAYPSALAKVHEKWRGEPDAPLGIRRPSRIRRSASIG